MTGISTSITGKFWDQITGLFMNLTSTQNIPIDEVKALLGIFFFAVACISGGILITKFIHYRKIGDSTKIIIEKNANQKLDDLIQSIEDFTNRWQFGTGILSSYRRQIEMNTLVLDHKELRRIMDYGSIIYPRIKSLREIGVPNSNNILDSLEQTVDKLVQLGSEMKRVYWSNKKFKIILESEPKIKNTLISDGDKISGEFDSVIVQLGMLRKHLP